VAYRGRVRGRRRRQLAESAGDRTVVELNVVEELRRSSPTGTSKTGVIECRDVRRFGRRRSSFRRRTSKPRRCGLHGAGTHHDGDARRQRIRRWWRPLRAS
jgi:hypothetical protein